MLVKCIKNDGYLFSPRKVREGLKQETTYNEITIDQEYNVCGIILFEDGLRYLLYDDCQMPYWYPAELFEVVEHRIPEGWYYEFFEYRDEGISAIWGYYELVYSENHFDALSEMEQEAIDLFLKRKKEMYD